MADVHSKQTRSYNMSQIKGKNTKPEMLVRKFLFSKGFRYKLHVNNLPGRPDIVLPKYDTVIFVHGCFWHGHPNCRRATRPQTNTSFWDKKINGNKARDRKNIRLLRKDGWSVLVIWQCQIKDESKLTKKLLQFAER